MPSAIGSSASPSGHCRRLAVDVSRLSELPARHVVVIIDRPRLDIAIMPVGAAPLCAIPIFERRVLSIGSAPAVLLVHGGADPVTDEAADHRACDRRRNASSAPAELTADQCAGSRSDKRPSILVVGASNRKNRNHKRNENKS